MFLNLAGLLSQHCTFQGPVASCSKGSAWPVFTDSFCRLQDHNFLASDICLLVGKTGPETLANFLVGGALACPLVGGAESWPSAGQSCPNACL